MCCYVHYLVKYLCSKIDMPQNWVKRTAIHKTEPFKTVAENIHPVTLASFCSLTKIFPVATPQPRPQNVRLYAPHSATKKKDIATKRLRARLKPSSITLSGRRHVWSWFEAGRRPVRSQIPLRCLVADRFEAGSKLVANRFEAGRGPASSC